MEVRAEEGLLVVLILNRPLVDAEKLNRNRDYPEELVDMLGREEGERILEASVCILLLLVQSNGFHFLFCFLTGDGFPLLITDRLIGILPII
jgi:hypothetical protein